jgi:alpha-beta hydrolase superfamily lysophospholipase
MPSPEPPPRHRGGHGEPLVLLHGINASWRIWTPVLPLLERCHDVFAPTLPGHLGGPPLHETQPVSIGAIADATEAILDAAGIRTAHLVGNSLGGWLAIELGRRGRARSVVALSPAGGWGSARDLHRVIRMLSGARAMIDRSDRLGLEQLVRRPRFRRLAFRGAMEHGERVPPGAAIEMLQDAGGCDAYFGFIAWVRDSGGVEPSEQPQDYPIRIAWGEHDRTIPFIRYGQPMLDAMHGAEHVTVPGVGHVPMFDDPGRVAQTILEVTQRPSASQETTLPETTDFTLTGVNGAIVGRRWGGDDPEWIVVLAHGIGEHSGRYEHVAQALAEAGAVVYAPDHQGHGRSEGERGLVADVELFVDDLRRVADLAVEEHPGLPLALLGHSLGGVIVTRYVQRGDERVAALVMTGPVIGGNPAFEGLLAMDPMPDVPIDPSVLSRDPEVGRAYAEDPLVYHGPLARESLVGIFAAVDAIRSGPGFGDLPTLWLHGEDDQLAPVEVTRVAIEQLRGSELTECTYPEARHEILNETNQEEVIAEITGFLSSRLTQTPAG